MTGGSIATRYARALFEEAQLVSVDREVYDSLGVFLTTFLATPELQSVLASPRIGKDKKHAMILTASGLEVPPLYDKFIRLVLLHNRELLIRRIILIYRDIYREQHNIDHVEFETAVPVDDATLEKVKAKVAARTGHEVELEASVKPQLMGGFRIRIGDTRYDYSYQTRLQNIKKKLLWNK